MSDQDHDTEYTKMRMQIQRGDGPDRRGKVEIETVRERPAARADLDTTEVTLPDGKTVRTTIDNSAFAEFFHETERALTLLEERLGLDQSE